MIKKFSLSMKNSTILVERNRVFTLDTFDPISTNFIILKIKESLCKYISFDILGKTNCLGMYPTPTNDSEVGFVFVICLYDDENIQDALSRIAYPICLMISNVFLLITFAVYSFLPELRQPLFGKITMIFILALTFAYSMAAIVKFIE